MNWKGGRTVDANGYVLIRVGKKHHLAHATGYAYEHRIVAEGMLGRKLKPVEQVHHKDGDRTNNRPSNLEVHKSQATHTHRHWPPHCMRRRPGEPNPKVKCACGCGCALFRFDDRGRPRFMMDGHNGKSPMVQAAKKLWKGKRV